MTQNLIVGLIVVFAALYAVWRWMPNGWRRSAASMFAAGTHKVTLSNASEGVQKTITVKITADAPTKVIQDLMPR